MSHVHIEDLPKKQQKLTITVTQEEMQPFIQEAVTSISTHTQIPGFRAGKADYDAVKRNVGEMKILEQALEPIVRRYYVQALLDHKIETVGSPKIDVEKMAPGNDLVFTAEVTLLPSVTTLADYTTLSIEGKNIEVEEKELSRALKDLQRYQTKEVRTKKDPPATKDHKVVVDMNMKKEHVPIEGGQGKNHAIYLNESYYIPGLIDQVIGMKEGEEKQFDLLFPKDHYQKHIAGETISFEVLLKELYNLEHPEIDDAFAKNLGQTDLQALKDILHKNILEEKTQQESLRQEKTLLETLLEHSQFEDIPDLIVNEEIPKMIEELTHHLSRQGIEFTDYLKQIKKTLGELKVDMAPEAIKRIKTALLIRAVAQKEHMTVEEKEVEAELQTQIDSQENEEIKKQLASASYKDYLVSMLKNKKVIEFLKEKMLK